MTDQEVLITISTQVGELKGSVDGLRGDVKGVRKDMQSLDDKMEKMPDRWSEDITRAITNCAKSRDDVSAAIDLTKERMLAKYGKKDSSPPSNVKRESWFSGVVKDALRPFITLMVVTGMAVGASLAVTKCSGGKPVDKATLQETKHAIDELKKQVKKANNDEQ